MSGRFTSPDSIAVTLPMKERRLCASRKELGFNLDVIDLLNSSKNSGYQVMRSRDIFLVALAAPIALMNGASRIFIEGFTEETPDEPFTGKEESMRMLNDVFRKWAVPIEVAWYNYEEIEAIGHLLTHRPGWLTLVQNCFCIPPYKPFRRERLLQSIPTFQLLDSQCGACMKCRMTNLARILYAKNDPTMRKVSDADISRYVASTVRWAVENHEKLADYIDGGFLKHLRVATRKIRSRITDKTLYFNARLSRAFLHRTFYTKTKGGFPPRGHFFNKFVFLFTCFLAKRFNSLF